MDSVKILLIILLVFILLKCSCSCSPKINENMEDGNVCPDDANADPSNCAICKAGYYPILTGFTPMKF